MGVPGFETEKLQSHAHPLTLWLHIFSLLFYICEIELFQLVESWTIQIVALLSASSLLFVRAFGLFYHLFETCFLNSSKKTLNKVCIVYPCYRGDFDINFATDNIKVNSQAQGWSLLFSRQSLESLRND